MSDAVVTARSHRSFIKEARDLVILAGPLIANNLSIAGMNFADTVMAGRLGAESWMSRGSEPATELLRSLFGSHTADPWRGGGDRPPGGNDQRYQRDGSASGRPRRDNRNGGQQ